MPATSFGQEWLSACVATRKAFHTGQMLSKINPEHARRMKHVLLTGDSDLVSELVISVGGPISYSENFEVKSANERGILKSLVESFIKPAVEIRNLVNTPIFVKNRQTTDPVARQAMYSVDLDDVKSWMAHWIDVGSMPDDLPIWLWTSTNNSVHGRIKKSERWADPGRIAHLVANGASIGSDEQRFLRAKLIAPAAPAIETAAIMQRISDSFLDVVEESQRSAAMAQASRNQNPIIRTETDDSVTQDAFARMVRDFDRS
jgi:hypothetical protein